MAHRAGSYVISHGAGNLFIFIERIANVGLAWESDTINNRNSANITGQKYRPR